MVKFKIGRRCPIIQMIKVGSEKCAKCEDFGGYDGDVCQCKSDEDLQPDFDIKPTKLDTYESPHQ